MHTDNSRKTLVRWGFLFGTLQACILGIIGLRYLPFFPEIDAIGKVFRVLSYVGHYFQLTLLVWGVTAVLSTLRFRPRWLIPVMVFLSVVLTIVAVTDTVVFSHYRFHLNAMAVSLVFGGAAADIFIFPLSMWLMILAVVAGIVLLHSVSAWGCWRLAQKKLSKAVFITAMMIGVGSLLGFNIVYAWADSTGYVEVTKQRRILPLFYPVTAKRFFGKYNVVDVHREPISRPQQSSLAYPESPLQCTASEQKPNIVFLVLDTWRYDMLAADTSPTLHKWAQKGLQFTDHVSGGNTTRTGIFSLFYGLPGTYFTSFLEERRGPVLMDQLIKRGYDIELFASARLTSPEFDRTIFVDVEPKRIRSKAKHPVDRDKEITDLFKSYVSNRSEDKPFFSFLFYDAIHAYRIPEDYPKHFHPAHDSVNFLTLKPDTEREPIYNLYKNATHYVDSLAGSVIQHLDDNGILDHTIVVVTSDHGEELNDQKLGYWGHNGNFSLIQTHIPMFILWPGKAPKIYPHPTINVDIAPTLMKEALACTSPESSYSTGRSLFDDSARDFRLVSSYSQYGILMKDRIVAVNEFQQIDVVSTSDYRPLADQTIPMDVIRQTIEKMSQFYR